MAYTESRKQYNSKNKEKSKKYKQKHYQKYKSQILQKQNEFNNTHKEQISLNRKIKYKQNKEQNNALRRKQYKDNPQKYLKSNKEYNSKPLVKEHRKQYHKNWRDNNVIKRRNYAKVYMANRYHNDIQFHIRSCLSARLNCELKRQNTHKSQGTLELCGCSAEELVSYLESQFKDGMNLKNNRRYGWHLDHIIPCSSFDLSDPVQQRKCYHYKNLQPLWWFENIIKGDMMPMEWEKFQIIEAPYLEQLYQKYVIPIINKIAVKKGIDEIPADFILQNLY